ncbi:MAG TPA: BTAD domain-containing putative transcriptional regulator [Acetobacteraceae bacterium]|nr:BTAD domain-containing putative transcriptional regulator [Acetobacteraceae bacterium]
MSQSLILPGTDAVVALETAAPAPLLLVSVMGGATFLYGDREIRLRNRKGRAMLAYLALSETGEEQRERLAGMFWSEASEQHARATLRQAVHELREAMDAAGCPALIGTRMTVGLRAGSFRVDLHELLGAVAAGHAPDALLRQARLAETLLEGLDDLDPSFHGWVTARRQTVHDRLIRGLEEAYREASLPRRQRRRLAQAALLLDPTHEEACRVLMRCAAEDGEIGAALRAYDELYRLLGEEYDQEPSALTQELVAEVKQGKFDAAVSSADGAVISAAEVNQAMVAPRDSAPRPQQQGIQPPKPALFLAPFAINGVDPDRVHLVEGFRFDLIACLVRFREWYVAGSDAEASNEHAGAPVASRYRLVTTAYQAGATINAVMVLEEQATGLAIWSERFELRIDNWSETQQRVVRRIAATLNVQLSIERLTRVSGVPDVSLEAHDAWLRAQSLLRHFSPENWNRAVTILAEAAERAPNYSPLYSSLVQMHNSVHIAHPGVLRDHAKEERTLALAQRAVALDPRDSQAELCLGWSLAMNKRYGQAQVHMGIACDLNPYDSWTLVSVALFHAFSGQVQQAQAMAARALEMSLLPSLRDWTYYATVCFLCGDDEKAVAAADLAQTMTPTLLAWRAAALWYLQRHDEAREDARQFLAVIRGNWFGVQPPTDAAIGRWLLHLYPIGHAPSWERLRAGVTAAGIPDGGMAHHGW